MSDRVWQPVVNIEYFGACRYTGYIDRSVWLILKCGHKLGRKASQRIPAKALCRECARPTTDKGGRDG